MNHRRFPSFDYKSLFWKSPLEKATFKCGYKNLTREVTKRVKGWKSACGHHPSRAGADRLRRVSHAERALGRSMSVLFKGWRDGGTDLRAGLLCAPWRRGPRHSHDALSPGGGRTLSTRSPTDCAEVCLQLSTTAPRTKRRTPARSQQLSRLAPTTTLGHRCAAPPATSLLVLSLSLSGAHTHARAAALSPRKCWMPAPISPIRMMLSRKLARKVWEILVSDQGKFQFPFFIKVTVRQVELN